MNLPSPESLSLPTGTVIAIPGNGLTVYRLIRTDAPDVRDFQPQPVARAIAAGWPELLRLGLSHLLTREQARSARVGPSSGLAAIRLLPDAGVHVARTGRRPGHVTVWARPEALLAAATVVK